MISATDIQKCIDKRAVYLVQDLNGVVKASIEKPNKDYPNDGCWLSGRWLVILGKVEVAEFQGKDWTECIYKFEPDYSQWIGKLCLFSDDEEYFNMKHGLNGLISILKDYDKNYSHPFETKNETKFKYCRPLRKDEVSFVEDCDE